MRFRMPKAVCVVGATLLPPVGGAILAGVLVGAIYAIVILLQVYLSGGRLVGWPLSIGKLADIWGQPLGRVVVYSIWAFVQEVLRLLALQ
jgi:hypothetical protein